MLLGAAAYQPSMELARSDTNVRGACQAEPGGRWRGARRSQIISSNLQMSLRHAVACVLLNTGMRAFVSAFSGSEIMSQISRRVWTGLLLTAGFSVSGLLGCSGGAGGQADETLGQMNLPLTTQGASGANYRLRDATFVIQTQYYGGYAGWSSVGGGGPGTPGGAVVSSETDPDATNISVSLEEGYYNVQLLPGWSMEKTNSSGTETVEATLLSGSSQWVYVSRQSTSWAEFSFGIGGREIWLNGQLNIAIDVQETPGGFGGAAGFGTGGAVGNGGASGAFPVPPGGSSGG